MKSLAYVFSLGCLVAASVHALAQPTVDFAPLNGGDADITQSGGEYFIDIEIWEWQQPVTVTVTAQQSHDIGEIFVKNLDDLVVCKLEVVGPNSFTPCGPVDKIHYTGGLQTILVELNSLGPIGDGLGANEAAIAVDSITTMRVTGDVLADIELFLFQLGDGQIGGDLKGDIRVYDRPIDFLLVSGDVGSPTEPVFIGTHGPITFLECANLYASISTKFNGGNAQLRELRVVGTGSDPEDGNFVGSLDTNYLLDDNGSTTIFIENDLDADIQAAATVQDAVVIEGEFDEDRIFRIGGRVTPSGSIQVQQSAGLHGQFVMNANNQSQSWEGAVSVGGTTLTPVPYYNNKSSTIGGGAVGLVPYNCHLKDCDPVGSQPYLDECDQGYNALRKVGPTGQVSSVTLRHYGRILRAGTGKPFTVKRKQFGEDPCDGGAWTDITDSGPFTITMHPNDELRVYRIEGPFAPGYDYMIQPKRTVGQGLDYLYCDDLDFNEANRVALEDYGYRLRVVLIQDINLSGSLEPADIDAWIDEPVDTTLDGFVNNEDLADVVDAVANGG